MKNKIFLSSMLIMSVAPAMAETFPTDGYMKENKTYTNAATETNMDGVYEGSVNATAEYDTIDYILTAGKYLPKDSETITTCPAGSFCAGGTTVQYNQSAPQGIETCPSGYTNSADGASSNTQCYRACDVNNMGANGSIANISHATAISGNDYYGAGVDTCEPTACENGWHVKAGTLDLNTLIGSDVSTGYADNGNGTTERGVTGNMTYDEAGISGDFRAFAVKYGNKGIIKGHGTCDYKSNVTTWQSASSPSDITTSDSVEHGVEGYCWCKLDAYIPNGGSVQNLSGPWVVYEDLGIGDDCSDECQYHCAEALESSNIFRTALFNSVTGGEVGPAICEANTITINWSDASQTDIDANNAGTATYGSDVRTPVKAATKKGKTFKGWRFSKPEQTNL